jgi:hypothetical protein
MGVQGELGVWSASAPYRRIHGGFKILSEELVALDKGVVAQFAVHHGVLDTIRADSSTTVAVSMGLKRKWEQHQGTGGGEDMRRMKEETRRLTTGTQNLQDKVIQLEDVLVQVMEFLKSLNDKVEAGGGSLPAAP